MFLLGKIGRFLNPPFQSITSETGSIVQLPLIINSTMVYQESDSLTIEDDGWTLKCHFTFDVCFFEISGWYFGKTSGLWGTMNNEPFDDFLSSTKRITEQVPRFSQSWSVGRPCNSFANRANLAETVDPYLEEVCEALFISKLSPLHACFQQIDTEPFYRMCVNGETETNACSLSVAYAGACAAENSRVNIPDNCVKCPTWNGTRVHQGEHLEWNEKSRKVSADIVFLVEAKKCNEHVVERKNLELLVHSLEKEISLVGISSARYGVVLFGGDNVYRDPRSVVAENRFFVSSHEVLRYLADIPTGNGTSDIFSAINYATRLIFRPGASKTFILLPCSDCSPMKMKNVSIDLQYRRDKMTFGYPLHIVKLIPRN